MSQKTRAELEKELHDLEELMRYKDGLPHIFGQRFYPWQRRVWDSTNPDILLNAANQIGKSSIAIRKNIRLATDPTLWPKFWPKLMPGQKPNLFFYFYPSLGVAQTEFATKWLPYHMPRGEFKDHPQFGWREEYEKGNISRIHFNTGVMIQFKAYSIKVSSLQTSTVFHVTADEELPVEYYPELKARLNASDGLFLMVFTATLGQDYWRRAMEPATPSEEILKEALKLQISLFDCAKFDDGTDGPWDNKKIQRAIANCPTQAEVQRRVYGRFVKATGLLFEAFSVSKNVVEPSAIPRKWSVWSGVDVGSGGQSGHPAAIVFVAVSEDFRRARVFRAWRGDGIPTTATDIVEKYRELKKDLTLTSQAYDFSSADFFTVASRLGESFVPAIKKRERGIGLLNALFKSGMLTIDRDDPELEKLVQELTSLGVNDNKRRTTDDLCFAGSTKIVTARGEIPIADIKLGDLVLTRAGMRPVSAITQSVARVINVIHTSGGETWVTPNHNYITGTGLKAAAMLASMDSCLGLSREERQSFTFSKELSSDVARSRLIQSCETTSHQVCKVGAAGKCCCFIAKFTRILKAKFQKAMWFIILTTIRSTMIRRIWRLLADPSMLHIIRETPSDSSNQKKPSRLLGTLQTSGAKLLRVVSGKRSWQSCLGKIASTLRRVVRFAAKPFLWSFREEQAHISAPIVVKQQPVAVQALMTSKKFVWFVKSHSWSIDTVRQKPVVVPVAIRAGRKSKLARVYNITVEGEHEYFADGVLVANCDALRYAVMHIPFDFEGVEGLPDLADILDGEAKPKRDQTDLDWRREGFGQSLTNPTDIQDEFDFWNEMSGG